MTKPTALLACLLLFLPPAIASAQPTAKLRIQAGAVQVTDGAMTASFKVTQDSEGIPSPGTGGACLVFSERRRGGARCSLDADCTAGPDFPGGYGYCLRDTERSEQGPRGRCWVRPAESAGVSYCRRSRTEPYALDQDIGFPVDGSGAMQPVANPSRGWWRVHACLNEVPGGCAVPDGAQRMTSDGPPKRLP